jgi:hypothetical protein
MYVLVRLVGAAPVVVGDLLYDRKRKKRERKKEDVYPICKVLDCINH